MGTSTPAAALLTRARDRIASPERWTTKVSARSAAGRKVSPDSRRAVAWCALGAIDAELARQDGPHRTSWYEIDRVLDRALLGEIDRSSVMSVNDDLGHAAALSLLERAAEIAGAS